MRTLITYITALSPPLYGLTGLAFLAGCATPPVYPTKPVTACEYKQTKEGVTVGVHPVFASAELDQFFKTDLWSRGILPLLVVVQNNNGNATYLLAGSNCRIPEAASLASQEDLPTRRTEGYLIGGVAGGAIMSDAASKRVGMADKDMTAQTVSPGESEQGFVFFKFTQPRPVKGSPLSARVHLPRTGTNQPLDFEFSIICER